MHLTRKDARGGPDVGSGVCPRFSFSPLLSYIYVFHDFTEARREGWVLLVILSENEALTRRTGKV